MTDLNEKTNYLVNALTESELAMNVMIESSTSKNDPILMTIQNHISLITSIAKTQMTSTLMLNEYLSQKRE